MNRTLKNLLVTGGAGFIGCNFIRYLFSQGAGFSGRIINLDALTYAGNRMSLDEIESRFGPGNTGGGRYFFEHGDICDRHLVETIFQKYHIDTVVHFAAESHVDRSILEPETFIKTNVMGTFVLLDTAREYWKSLSGTAEGETLFHHVSTDEVYGSLGETGLFSENSRYDPRSPYSASKAAGDHLAMSYYHTYGV
ncbi:MAG: GDP-mannose 4,6-dehydratase, partial [Treponema sp.]|nr:GDP-mannose 4,6-dehydratase [Treponema sp.]